MLEKSDITVNWVIDNFDLDKERKNRKAHFQSGQIDLDVGFDYFQGSDGLSFPDFIVQLTDKVTEQVFTNYKTKDLFAEDIDLSNIKIKIENERERWDDWSTPYLYVNYCKTILETDDEVIKRLITSEKRKITLAENKVKAKAKKVADEKAELKRLAKKLGVDLNDQLDPQKDMTC